MVGLSSSRAFVPLFVTQFLGAFNDNLFKTAMLFLITFQLAGVDLRSAATMVTAAAGVFIVPFFLFSGIAGQLADARDKAAIARAVKLAEVVILGIGGVALLLGSVPLLFATLFGMGTHSTVFGPVKYAILPQHLRPDQLLTGTGLVEGGTFVAILLGQIAGGLLPTKAAAAAMIVAALAGVAASRFIPAAPPAAMRRIDWNPVTSSVAVMRAAFAMRPVWLATLAISWFWALGAVFTAEFVPLVKGSLHASEAVATLFLAVFTVGIATGSAAVGRLLGGHVSARAAPWAAAGMAAASLSLLLTVGAGAALWPVLLALFVLAFAGGIFSVPLYGILQTAGDARTRSGAVAANNIVNAAFQVGGTLIAGSAFAAGVPIVVLLAASGASALALIPMLRRLQ
jgi:hypothetical protein